MKGSEIRQKLNRQLRTIYNEREAGNISEMVMEKITGQKRIDRLINDPEINEELSDQFNLLLQRLLNHEPVQYVLGEAWFCGMKLTVDKQVLIPRPETEELVEWVIDTVQEWTEPAHRHYKILDVGTGSGCIAIALQKKLPAYFETWACDKSDGALTIARKNADDQKALVDFVPMDFLDADQQKQLPHVDIVVSNPPYIPASGKNTMADNVVKYEPSMALFVPDEDPLQFYKALASFGKFKLQENGWLLAEIHEDLGQEVKDLWINFDYKNVEIKKDLQGKDRLARAQYIP